MLESADVHLRKGRFDGNRRGQDTLARDRLRLDPSCPMSSGQSLNWRLRRTMVAAGWVEGGFQSFITGRSYITCWLPNQDRLMINQTQPYGHLCRCPLHCELWQRANQDGPASSLHYVIFWWLIWRLWLDVFRPSCQLVGHEIEEQSVRAAPPTANDAAPLYNKRMKVRQVRQEGRWKVFQISSQRHW